jgi:hypothetical protein
VVFVPPFSIDLIFSRFQGVDAAIETLVPGGQPIYLCLNPISSGGTHHLVTSRPRVTQFLADTSPFAAVHEDFILNETLKLTDGLLKMLLFTFLDIALIDEHRLVYRVVQ